MKFRKKPVVIEAIRWFKSGDHENVRAFDARSSIDLCKHCDKPLVEHGWISTKEGGHIACPGDWIITGVQGEQYPCKPNIFAATYDPA